MKKAKMMLLAIAILAVVGGALAFKTHKFGGSMRCGMGSIACINMPYEIVIAGSGTMSYCTKITAPASATCYYTKVNFLL